MGCINSCALTTRRCNCATTGQVASITSAPLACKASNIALVTPWERTTTVCPGCTWLGESITANVPQDDMIYYRWTATAAGKLTVTSPDPINNISLNNLANSKVTDFTNGAESVTLEVAEGDTITIVVSVIGGDKQAETNPVTFTLTLGE